MENSPSTKPPEQAAPAPKPEPEKTAKPDAKTGPVYTDYASI